jgi:hypothetical protein
MVNLLGIVAALYGLTDRFNDSSFWDAFWPNMAATFIGVALGIPSALWINRVATRASNRREQLRQIEQLRSLATTLQTSIQHNLEPLRLLAALTPDSICWVTGLEHAIWQISQEDAVKVLSNYALKVDLARHFENLAQLEKLNDQYIKLFMEASAGEVPAADIRITVRSLIVAIASQAGREGEGLARRLQEYAI